MHSEISSLTQLINQLKSVSKEKYKSIGVQLDIPLQEFLPYTNWCDDHYTRNCIIREEKFELILLCWEPGQTTPVHCHGGEECWVYIMDGRIDESHYQFSDDILIKENTVKLLEGEKSFMSDELGYHKLENNYPQRAVSLHLYMDPIDDCTVYDKQLEEFMPMSLSYYSYKGVLEDIEV